MPTDAPRTARERARASLTREILDEARRQLAEVGAAQLSLRAVARELGMASSAVYRYVASRDDLLTALIVESYTELGDAVDAAEGAVDREDHRARFAAVLHGLRTWSRAHPQEHALLYGSPVPGYRAPQTTVEPAARVPVRLMAVMGDAAPKNVPGPVPVLPQELSEQLAAIEAIFGLELPREVTARAMFTWTHLVGVVSMELFGHLVGSVDPTDAFFGWVVEQLADLVGL